MILNELYAIAESSGHSLQGSFTHDLTKSKVWLMQELAKVDPNISTMYILGSWYGNLALYMTLDPVVQVKKFINVETNKSMLDQSRRMMDHIGAQNVEYMNRDANKLDYRQVDSNSVVVNNSLTDMDGTEWFNNIPDDTLVVMQARDNVDSKPFYSTQDILKKFPLNDILYQGELNLQDPETTYTRYMVIGRK
jgi:precorrin-6B methylase 2